MLRKLWKHEWKASCRLLLADPQTLELRQVILRGQILEKREKPWDGIRKG